jgi:hypothetical protein
MIDKFRINTLWIVALIAGAIWTLPSKSHAAGPALLLATGTRAAAMGAVTGGVIQRGLLLRGPQMMYRPQIRNYYGNQYNFRPNFTVSPSYTPTYRSPQANYYHANDGPQYRARCVTHVEYFGVPGGTVRREHWRYC